MRGFDQKLGVGFEKSHFVLYNIDFLCSKYRFCVIPNQGYTKNGIGCNKDQVFLFFLGFFCH